MRVKLEWLKNVLIVGGGSMALTANMIERYMAMTVDDAIGRHRKAVYGYIMCNPLITIGEVSKGTGLPLICVEQAIDGLCKMGYILDGSKAFGLQHDMSKKKWCVKMSKVEE